MQKYYSTRQYQPKDQLDYPEKSFREHFNGPKLWTTQQLWREYQRWRKNQQLADYERFENYVMHICDNNCQEVDSWPNPLINGRKGSPYEIIFRVPQSVSKFMFYGFQGTGLEYSISEEDEHICTVKGIPTESGEFTITFVYAFLRNNIWFGRFQREFKFTINPDPKELWKDIPTDPTIEYFKEDMDEEKLECVDTILVAASRRGRSHAHAGLPRDDDFGLACVNGWKILAVADGAGSAPFSRQGSAMACAIAIESLRDKLEEDFGLEAIFSSIKETSNSAWLQDAKKLAYNLLPQAAFSAYKSIRAEAQSREREIREYATTLLLALCKEFEAGWIVMSFQIGDGAMAMFHKNGNVELLAEPDEGEYGGQTRFITMKEIYESNELMRRLRIDLVADLDMLMLMTDGVSDARFATLANLNNPQLWQDLRQEVEPLMESGGLTDWLQFWSQGNHDDRTIAIMAGDIK